MGKGIFFPLERDLLVRTVHRRKWKKIKFAQLCPTLHDPMDCTVHGILQAKILEWVAYPFSRGSSQPRNWTGVSCITGRFFTNWAIREVHRRKRSHYTASPWGLGLCGSLMWVRHTPIHTFYFYGSMSPLWYLNIMTERWWLYQLLIFALWTG